MPQANQYSNHPNNFPDKTKPSKSVIDFKQAFKLRFLHGVTHEVIAKQFGVTRSAVTQILEPVRQLMEKAELFPIYNKNASTLQEIGEAVLLQEMLSEEKLKKASVNNLAYAYDKLNQARRGHTASGSHITIELVFQEAEQAAKKLRRSTADIVINKDVD